MADQRYSGIKKSSWTL